MIAFTSCTKINLFILSRHESYKVNLLPTTRLTSNSQHLLLFWTPTLPLSRCNTGPLCPYCCTGASTSKEAAPLHLHEKLSWWALSLALGAMMDARHTMLPACTSSNEFVSGMAGWKFVFGQEDVESFFFKAQNFSGAIGIPRRTCNRDLFS